MTLDNALAAIPGLLALAAIGALMFPELFPRVRLFRRWTR